MARMTKKLPVWVNPLSYALTVALIPLVVMLYRHEKISSFNVIMSVCAGAFVFGTYFWMWLAFSGRGRASRWVVGIIMIIIVLYIWSRPLQHALR